MRGKVAGILLCLAIFHLPDGQELRLETQHILAVRPADTGQTQLHHDVKSVIYVGQQKFGVVETDEQVEKIMRDCLTDGEPQ